MSTTRAPCATSFSMVGSAARMRVSSVTTPSFTGTLKSTRMSARLPCASSSSMVFDVGHGALLSKRETSLPKYELVSRRILLREGS